jgi:hypothetical protein
VKLEANAGVLSSFDFAFLKSFSTWANLMAENQHTGIKTFQTIWLTVHLQDRKKVSQRFCFSFEPLPS